MRQDAGMEPFPIPENLSASAARDRFPDRRDWIAELPGIVRDLADRWDLRLGPPYQPGGECSWVAPARDGAGRDLVLKVGWVHDESAHEADGLRHWNGDGTVLLHDAYAFGRTSALLLERCDPGTPLGDALPGPAQDLVVADLLSHLWTAPADGPFRSLESMCHTWADQFEEKLAPTPEHGLDPGLTRAGLALFRELPATATRSALLCTDLHAANILAARRRPWLVIDPKPYVGDPTYDPLQHMLNCRDRLGTDPGGLADRLAGLLDLDAERLRRWLFARCVQESIDSPWLGTVAKRLA